VYYPTASGWRDFVVDAKIVDDAMNWLEIWNESEASF